MLIFGEQDSAETSRLQLLLLGEPRVLKPLSGSEDLSRRAPPGAPAPSSSMRPTVSSGGAASRRRRASPSICSQRRRSKSQHRRRISRRSTQPGERPALGVNGATRSADGRRTAFTALGDLWLAERGEPRRLTDDAFVELDPAFWPDGDSLVFASERTGQFELWRLALRDGSSRN